MKAPRSGWVLFSMVVLLIAGVMRIFDGIWMLHNSSLLQPLLQGSLFGANYRTYGWIYLFVGVLLVLVAIGLARGSEVARWFGVAAGAVLAVSAVWLLPYPAVGYSPLVYIALGVGIVYGLTVHGGVEDSADDTTPEVAKVPPTE